MVYKKYIKRNGKLYGPYIYHSRRVNGKVISEYQGTGKKIDYIFVSGHLSITGATIIRDNDQGRYPSDHFPVIADLAF